jgi:hypothetical protein
MRAVLAVAERELRERRAVFAAALLAGVMALATPMVPWLGHGSFRDQCGVMALIIATAFSLGLGVTVGASMISRDLRERRLGFYFGRPIAGSALWFGKLAAALLLVLGAAALTLLPAILVGALPADLLPHDRIPLLAAAAAVGALLLLVLAHAAAIAARSRSLLVLLDLVLTLAVAGVVVAASLRLTVERAAEGLVYGLVAFGILALAALLAAGWVQVAVGRTDHRRGHRALSLTLWGVLGIGALSFAGYTWWFLAMSPRDLEAIYETEAAPRGPWLAITGRAWGRGDYEPTFLLDALSGRSVRLAAAAPGMGDIVFSADGRRAAWVAWPGLGHNAPAEVVTFDITADDAHPVGTTIFLTWTRGDSGNLTLSPDGGRVAVRDAGMLCVYETLSGKQLVAVRMPDSAALTREVFLGADRLRILGLPAAAHGVDRVDIAILELDIPTKRLEETGRIRDVARSALFFLRDGGGQKLLLRDQRDGTRALGLFDGRTGAPVATLAACGLDTGCQGTMLADGRVVVGDAGPHGARLRVFLPTGEEEKTIGLPPARAIRLGLEPTAGKLVVALGPDRLAALSDYATLVVDLTRGTWASLPRGYRPAGLSWWLRGRAAAAGSVGSRAFLTVDRSLVLLDPSTDTFRTVVEVR